MMNGRQAQQSVPSVLICENLWEKIKNLFWLFQKSLYLCVHICNPKKTHDTTNKSYNTHGGASRAPLFIVRYSLFTVLQNHTKLLFVSELQRF
jgi:hypothetical protein